MDFWLITCLCPASVRHPTFFFTLECYVQEAVASLWHITHILVNSHFLSPSFITYVRFSIIVLSTYNAVETRPEQFIMPISI